MSLLHVYLIDLLSDFLLLGSLHLMAGGLWDYTCFLKNTIQNT
jgi:hypothetical protein